jgi:sulfotransferase family protein
MRPQVRDALRRSRMLRAAVVAARHRGLAADDVFVASYPRSGNTLVRFLLAHLATGEAPDFESVDRLIPNVGDHAGAPGLAAGGRLVKTHEPYRREYRRAVYLVRDVRDVLVSWYRVLRQDPDDTADLDGFVRVFMTDRASPYGRWTDHVRSWHDARGRGAAILIRRFEDVRADPAAALREIAAHARIPVDDAAVAAAVAHNTPEEMVRLEQASLPYLTRTFGRRSLGVRSGSAGNWTELLTEEHLKVLEPALILNRQIGYGATAA